MLVKTGDDNRIKEAGLLLQEFYNKSGKVSALQGEVDENYLVTTDEGQQFVFKVCSTTPLAEIEFQNEMLHHLSGHTTVELPQVVVSKNGQDYEKIEEAGQQKILRLLTWVPGKLYGHVNPQSSQLLASLGEACGNLSRALVGFDHAAAHREYRWDPAQAHWVLEYFDQLSDDKEINIATHFYQLFASKSSLFKNLRQGINHNDINDFNIVVSDTDSEKVKGIIDFGDAIFTYTINELAIALAYGMMDKNDPLEAACHIIAGYHKAFPLDETEIEVLFALSCIRLIISVTSSAINKRLHPENEYLQISERPAWDLLKKLTKVHPDFACYRFRAACGWDACPQATQIRQIAEKYNLKFAAVVEGLCEENAYWMDLSVGSLELGNSSNYLDPQIFSKRVTRLLEDQGSKLGIGRYNEIRPIYTTDAYLEYGNEGPRWRTVHMGVDVFAPAGTAVFAAYDGQVHSFANNAASRDYGPTIILKHEFQGLIFYTLYGHLSIKSLEGLEVGKVFKKGELIAWFGDEPENGNWPPHLHFQMMSNMLAYKGDYPGVVFASELDTWKDLILDPLPYMSLNVPGLEKYAADEILRSRQQRLGKNLSLSYHSPLHIVRGYKQYLFDASGRRYLDMVNNVAHVGHEHEAVVKAGQEQMAVLNTNTRYLHDELAKFAEELTHTLPEPLEVCYFVNSGSEANELALRMVKANTGSQEMMVLQTGYHGNTNGCIDISSYKFDRKGGQGAPPHTHVLPTPDLYRGKYTSENSLALDKYVNEVHDALQQLSSSGRRIGGFIGESIMSCAGQIPLPDGYLKKVYAAIQKAGGLCIADEVQTGLGRVGQHFWAFQSHDVIPDIVTIGKPLGNGHPVAAVVTTREVSDNFANGMEYFNTFGGNPVSCAIGRTVLSIIKEEGLQQNALKTGGLLIKEIESLKNMYPIIGDVRGEGLFLGFELVREGKQPAAREATYLTNRMRTLGVLLSTDGPDENVIKIKPPLCYDSANVDFFLSMLIRVLNEDPVKF